MHPLPACGAILAGGASRRMGCNKALLPFQGKPLIQHTAERLRNCLAQVVVVSPAPDRFGFLGLPVVSDRRPGLGPMAGLEAALAVSPYPYVFLCACDMPFLNEGLVRYQVGLAGEGEIIIPRVSGLYEPLHAVYSRSTLPRVQALLDGGRHSLLDLLPGSRLRVVTEAEIRPFGDPNRLFFNCNTPEDIQTALKLLHA
ncbi:MAG TPA: molybdenum cofactor guanylyltransferase [Symbiobacteriaceae bacterium]